MPLDLNQVAAQVDELAARLKTEVGKRKERLELAVKLASSQEQQIEALKRKIATARTTWLVAGIQDGLGQGYEAPPCPGEFTVLAVDGSQIDVDRHSPVRCYLVNIGSVVLHYGTAPEAVLSSSPSLYFQEELSLVDPAGGEQLIEGPLLGIKRTVEECRQVARLAGELPQDTPTVALLDGSLILWGLAGQAYPEFVREALLVKGFLASLDELRKLSQSRKLAVASYISFPRSTDVVNILRLSLCPYEPADCDRFCPGRHLSQDRECDAVAGLRDRELFDLLLATGQRSPVFLSRSKIVQQYYGEHQAFFFYLKVGEEVSRVEIPQWIAEDRDSLDLVHALVLDQSHRGQGYPVALSEAHEKAVVTAADREQFWYLVEMALAENRLPVQGSAKSKSKQTRGI